MEQAVLTELQQQALQLVMHDEHLADYSLNGGTALAAFYFHHRLSDDLDFFTQKPVDELTLQSSTNDIKKILEASAVRRERVYDRRLFFFQFPDIELKMEFTYYPFPPLEEAQIISDVRVASLRDISAGKLMALLDRFDPKDFVDLYYILQTRALNDVRKDAEQKFEITISDLFLGGELAKVSRIEALPKMLTPIAIPALKSFFTEQAKQLTSQLS